MPAPDNRASRTQTGHKAFNSETRATQMRIAIVWNAPSRLVDISLRHDLYVRGFEALGHEVITVCTSVTAEAYPCHVHTVATSADLAEPDLWRRLRCDVAVMITWHGMADILAAMRAAGTKTVAIADSDGQVSMRVHPRATWLGMIANQPRWDLKARASKAWLQHYLLHSRAQDRNKLESTLYSDALVFCTVPAAAHFKRFLDYCGQGTLASRLRVVPYLVDEKFCQQAVPAEKPNRILGVARWDSPQKDARLMAEAIRIYLEQGGRSEFALIGPGGESWFSALAGRFPLVRYLGVQPPVKVASLLADSRAIAFSSRWESGPIAAFEALAVGSTVIGAPIPNLIDLCAGGRFGSASPTRRPADLAQAIHQEMNAWGSGQRGPRAIAEHWRAKLHPTVVCRQLLATIGS
jgi:glycosyltransferase involved in cell wall biosynthesis